MISKFYVSEKSARVEFCFYVVSNTLSENSVNLLESILSRDGRYDISKKSRFKNPLEIGPQTNFKTAWCQNMLDILHLVGLKEINRIEHAIRYADRKAPNYDKMLFRLYYPEYFESSIQSQTLDNLDSMDIDNIEYVSVKDYNRKMGLNLSYDDEIRYEEMFQKLGRQATNVEVYDLSQSQSEHARHWFFKGEINKEKASLFDKIKSCYIPEKHKTSLISFYDNASVVEGGMCNHLFINSNRKYEETVKKINFSYKAETHNFPTGISPFPGAATGSGGRIRDILCVGKGGQIVAGTAGYCVGEIPIVNPSGYQNDEYKWLPSTPQRILIEASNGASDYGNKIGEPLIQGFTRSYRQDFSKINKNGSDKNMSNDNKRIEWLKPIMFSGGIGIIQERDIKKEDARDKLLVVRVGGPAYRIGMGGGSASSRTQSTANQQDDFQAVQRGDPLMANKLCRFLRGLLNKKINPIVSIHDQGSGGMANVTREIAEGMGATVYLDRVYSGDPTLTSLEKWVAEYQEQITLLVEKKDFRILKAIGKRENISVVEVGEINNSKHLQVWDKSKNGEDDDNNSQKAVDIPMEIPDVRKKYQVKRKPKDYNFQKSINQNKNENNNYNLVNRLEKVFSLVEVGSKQFLTNKVDRSVGGLIVQQQCVGPFHLPLSNLAAVKQSFDSSSTLVSAIGEKPIIGVNNEIENMVSMSVGEMLTNIIWSHIGVLSNINSVANWMWPSIDETDGAELRDAVNQLCKLSHSLSFSINGGKDSLSMKVKNYKEEVKAPSTLTLSGYATINDHFSIITPNLKTLDSKIILIRLDKFRGGMLGSAYGRFYPTSKKSTEWLEIEKFPTIWKVIQDLINDRFIISGHDISDGGLITTLTEMAISSYFGLDLDINSDFSLEEYMFSEELGLVIEVRNGKLNYVIEKFREAEIGVSVLGSTTEEPEIFIKYNGEIVLNEKNHDLRMLWQRTSYLLEREQTNPECIEDEMKNCFDMNIMENRYPQSVVNQLKFNDLMHHKYDADKPKVAIMRADGSNGEMEMAYAFLQVGFEPEDINIYDATKDNFNFEKFRGIIWVGGFTYGDVLGAAEGWYQVLNLKKKELDDFYAREDTFSLGVCNGCQMMTRLGWVEGLKMESNNSGRFESRWSQVKITQDDNIFFKGLKDVTLGIYSAHGEGKMTTLDGFHSSNTSFPVRYVDRENNITQKYPFNPNGSREGRAAAISANGRHLAIMPHPERTILSWQVPHKYGYNYTPWFIMFKNLYSWCMNEDLIDEESE